MAGGYDPFAPQPLAANNALAPVAVGMVPGVPGSMAPNPGGPIMTPGGGGTGAPLQGQPTPGMPRMPAFGEPYAANMQNFWNAFQQFRTARTDWRSQRPTMAAGETPQDFQSAMSTWRTGRPQHQDYWTGGIRNGQFGTAYIAPTTTTSTVPPLPTAGSIGV